MKRWLAVLTLSASAAGCAAVQPALETLAIAFGQDLISSASANYTPRYATEVESLLVALARKGTGLDLEPQLHEADYRRPPRGGEAHGGDAYAEEEYADMVPYESGAGEGYGYPADGYAGLALDAAIFVRRSGATTLETVYDGDVLYDGGPDPASGDLLQFYFSSNRDAWVYVIGIDATGYVAQIFPDPAAGLGNPVQAGREYVLPGGNQWWGLDAQPGAEQVYFVASEMPRDDIEQVIERLLAQPREISGAGYVPVRRPAVVRTRGLVRVGDAAGSPAGMPSAPAGDTWYAPASSSEVVLTRWFLHESRL